MSEFCHNSPKIRAESRVYTTVGSGVPRAYLGVRARLFKSGEAAIPDLVAVIATNGKTGYITKSALDGSKPKNPTEALAQETRGRTVPVCATDGVTKIGDFAFA